MNTLSIPQVTIVDQTINIVDGLFSLNDVHKASGGATKHKPAFFLRNEQTKEVISELQKCNSEENVLKVVRGGVEQGTWACKELVYSYAMWISAKFHIFVVRAFDAMVTRTDSKQRECLITACDKLAVGNTIRSEVYTMVANHFGYERVTQIPSPLLPEAVAFVYDMILARQKATSEVDRQTAIDTHKWALAGMLKHDALCKSVRELDDILSEARLRLNDVKFHNSTIWDAICEQKRPSITPDERKVALQQAEELISNTQKNRLKYGC